MYCRNKATLYSIVLGKCTEDMKNRLEGKGVFDNIEK